MVADQPLFDTRDSPRVIAIGAPSTPWVTNGPLTPATHAPAVIGGAVAAPNGASVVVLWYGGLHGGRPNATPQQTFPRTRATRKGFLRASTP